MIAIFQQNNNNKQSIPEYLPTPQISIVGVVDNSLWNKVDKFSWKNIDISGVLSQSYTNRCNSR